MKITSILLTAALSLAAALAYAQADKSSSATGAAASPSTPSTTVDIGGGRKMYLKCHGTASPTVVLVGGLRASADDWNVADKSAPAVFPEVARFTRVCAYDRPGTPVGEKPSRSDPVPHATTAKEDFEADATEMEGAAVGQICWQQRVPCLVLRSLSDDAGAEAEEDVRLFEKTAAQNSALLVTGIIARLESK